MNSQLLLAARNVIADDKILVNMVSLRVRQLASGSRPLLTLPPGMGAADVALSEIAEKKLSYETVAHEDWVKPSMLAFPRPAYLGSRAAA
ncbi:MAG: DNA-directed RNA polymerase subunit omega [Chthoniobacterales bacterium]|nr:DNA-directed RNA polymerase subunit omega [Chthoniobacterales bacterium]